MTFLGLVKPNAAFHAHKSHLAVQSNGSSGFTLQVLRVLRGVAKVGSYSKELFLRLPVCIHRVDILLVIQLQHGLFDDKKRSPPCIANDPLLAQGEKLPHALEDHLRAETMAALSLDMVSDSEGLTHPE